MLPVKVYSVLFYHLRNKSFNHSYYKMTDIHRYKLHITTCQRSLNGADVCVSVSVLYGETGVPRADTSVWPHDHNWSCSQSPTEGDNVWGVTKAKRKLALFLGICYTHCVRPHIVKITGLISGTLHGMTFYTIKHHHIIEQTVVQLSNVAILSVKMLLH